MPLSDYQLAGATAKELIAAFGKSAKVYAPYVLLRSLQEWRSRPAITLPADVRAILEATYAEPVASEPKAWRQLRDELERRKRELADTALSATNIWSQPALPDDDGVQTRFSSYPTASLLVVNSVEMLAAQTVRLHLLDGTHVEAGAREWDFEAAKSIHRNLARLPKWAVAAALQNPPGWLTNHVSQPAAVGLLRTDGRVGWLGSETETGLSYHADQGFIIRREAVARKPREELDESYD